MGDFCNKFNILDLKLPYVFGDLTCVEENVGGVRWLYAYKTEKKDVDEFKKTIKTIDVQKINQVIKDKAFLVKAYVVSSEAPRFTLICSIPIVLINFKDLVQGTVIHETAHSLMNYFLQDKNHSKIVALIIDIYFSLVNMSVILPKDIEVRATECVDPVHWQSPSAASEHPSDNFDEFFASAVEAFLTNNKGLINSFNHFIKYADSKNRQKLRDDTSRLLTVLDAIFKNNVKGIQGLKYTTPEDVIAREISRAIVTPDLKDTLVVHPVLVRLFAPDKR